MHPFLPDQVNKWRVKGERRKESESSKRWMGEAQETSISKVPSVGNWDRIRKETRMQSDDVREPGWNFNPNKSPGTAPIHAS